jgi:hypothetical protein
MQHKIKLLILVLISFVAFSAMFFVKPIPQDEAYHKFADQREILGIPNFWNVISNAPLFLVSLIGTIAAIKKKWVGFDTPAYSAYLLFFIGVGFIGLGSAYYHLNPETTTLFWDRLPMAFSFMAFFSLVITEHVHEKLGRVMLWPLIVLGCGSVLYWHWSELSGSGDLRPYALVQFLPIVLTPFMVITHQARFTRTKDLYIVLFLYLFAKLAEHFDSLLYALGRILSGHSIKHFLAALGAFWLLRMLRLRLPSSSFPAS